MVISGEREYVRGTETVIMADRSYYDSNDCIRIVKDGTAIFVESLNR